MLAKDDSRSTRSVSRSGSLLGTIKGFLPSKLFGWSGDSADTPGKRKGVEESYEAEEGQRSSKRQRVDGPPVAETPQPQVPQRPPQQLAPPPASKSGYLEPPDNFFGSSNATAAPRQGNHVRATSLAPSTRPLPASSSTRSVSSTGAHPFGRTMSMDPPNRYRPSYGAGPKPAPLSRDVSMDDGSFDKGMSTSPTLPFRMRTSLTPQPSGMAFGPEPARRERNDSEPPPLAQLIDKPVFVKAPSEAPQPKASTSQAPITLGALAEAHRTGKSVQRSHSSLNIGSASTQEVAPTPAPEPVRPINTTEKILRELEVYKTPLLPTRLRGSNGIPEMFKPKKGHGLVLMHDRDSKSRLGSGEKSEKDLEDNQVSKPYAGRGGMKKLLARRRQEEEEEKEKERLSAIETDEEEALRTSQKAKELDEKLVKDLSQPLNPEPEPQRASVGGRAQSSLRVGRTKSSRNHIDRPKAKGKGGGRFSALYEEEEEDAMDDGFKQESPKKLPAWAPPPGFSFAKDTAPLSFDATNSKEAPISSLPFSLTPPVKSSDAQKDKEASKPVEKPTSIPLPRGFSHDSGDVPHPSPPVTVAAESLAVAAPAPLTPLLSAVPQIALIPPSPGTTAIASAPKQPAAEQLDASVTGKASSAVPNFFASSAALNKPSAQVSLPSNFSFGIPSSTTSAAPAASAPKDTFSFGSTGEKKDEQAQGPVVSTHAGDDQHPKEASKVPQPPLFSGFGTSPASIFNKPSENGITKTLEPAKEPTKEPVVAAPTPVSAFSFGKAPEKTDKPAFSGFSFGTSKPAEAPSTTPSPLPFSFGQPAKPAETTSTESRPTTGDAAPKPFAFGAPSTGTAQASPFGTPSPSAAEPPKSPFAFPSSTSQPSGTTPAPAAPATEGAKSLFGGTSGFTFGQPSAASSSAESGKGFTFGTPAPSTPTAEKQPFVFGAATSTSTPAPAASTLFGTPAPNGTAAPTTPPKKDEGDLSMMDETSSPNRGNGMELNGNKAEPMSLNGPGFGMTSASTTSLFGQPAQTGSSGFVFGSGAGAANPFATKTDATKPPESKPASGFSFGQPAASSGFSFGQKAADGGSTPTATTGFSFGKPAESAAPATSSPFGFGSKPAEPAPATTAPSGFSFGAKPAETNAAPSTTGFSFGTPATPTTSGSGFSFGAPQIASSTSFGQATSATSTTPSPNPFSQPAQPSGGGFSFAIPTPTSATAPSQPFAFGSQPASPATTSAGLPGQNGATGFFGAGTAPASTPSPFAPPAALPPAGGPVFTMGAAPPPTPGAAGRPVKKLPTRNRGGKR